MSRRRRREALTAGFRADIQALRAVAIAAVILYHLWPNRLTGGYIGVDVFFVISGYLITSHILRGIERERPTQFLVNFYARRIRRLAPAAVVVLAFTLIATAVLLPAASWGGISGHVIASASFVENWHLAASAVSYLNADAAPSALQHFWSLSVEEQFYIVWPLLLIGVSLLAAKRGGRRTVLAAIVAVGVLSFVWSLYFTAASPDAAFFNTPARIWQFCAGGILPFFTIRDSTARFVLPWAGLVALVISTVTITETTPFPGWAALVPTLATAAIIAGNGDTKNPAAAGYLARFAPVQWLGNVSYSAYLWHWPLIVLIPIWLGHDLGTRSKVAIIVATAVVAQLSYLFIETPVRQHQFLTRTRLRTFTAGAAVLALIAGGSVTTATVANAAQDRAQQQLIAKTFGGDPCFAARAVDNPKCDSPWGQITQKAAEAGADDEPLPWRDDCFDDWKQNSNKFCTYGDEKADTTVLLWGDSHAGSWSAAFDMAGKIDHFRVIVAMRNKCPSSMETPIAGTYGSDIPKDVQTWCQHRNDWVMKTLVPKADTVVLANFSANYVFRSKDQTKGYQETVKQVRAAHRKVTLMEHIPLTNTPKDRRNGPTCLTDGRDDCVNAQSAAYDTTHQVPAGLQKAGLGDDVSWIPVSDRFCHDNRCYYAIGGTSVYWDASHMSNTYATSLGPWLARSFTTKKQLSAYRF